MGQATRAQLQSLGLGRGLGSRAALRAAAAPAADQGDQWDSGGSGGHGHGGSGGAYAEGEGDSEGLAAARADVSARVTVRGAGPGLHAAEAPEAAQGGGEGAKGGVRGAGAGSHGFSSLIDDPD